MTEVDTTDASTDEALVLAARSGDRAAVARLYERYAPVVHGVLLARVSVHDADDLTHDVFLAAMAGLGSLREAGAFGAWICAAARNRAKNVRRSWWRRVWTGSGTEAVRAYAEAREAGAARDPEAAARARRVMEELRALPEAYRETLVLRLVEGLTGPQIAERTGMTHGSVRVNLTKGMAMLRARLGEGER